MLQLWQGNIKEIWNSLVSIHYSRVTGQFNIPPYLFHWSNPIGMMPHASPLIQSTLRELTIQLSFFFLFGSNPIPGESSHVLLARCFLFVFLVRKIIILIFFSNSKYWDRYNFRTLKYNTFFILQIKGQNSMNNIFFILWDIIWRICVSCSIQPTKCILTGYSASILGCDICQILDKVSNWMDCHKIFKMISMLNNHLLTLSFKPSAGRRHCLGLGIQYACATGWN